MRRALTWVCDIVFGAVTLAFGVPLVLSGAAAWTWITSFSIFGAYVVGRSLYEWKRRRDLGRQDAAELKRKEVSYRETILRPLPSKLAELTDLIMQIDETADASLIDRKHFGAIIEQAEEERKRLYTTGQYSWEKWMSWIRRTLDSERIGIRSWIGHSGRANRLYCEIQRSQRKIWSKDLNRTITQYMTQLLNIGTALLTYVYGKPAKPSRPTEPREEILRFFDTILSETIAEDGRRHELAKEHWHNELTKKATEINGLIQKELNG